MKAGHSTSSDWSLFPHDADIGVQGHGNDVAEAFANAARAMTSAIVPPGQVRCARRVRIICEAPDLELLLVDWLNALIYEMATRRMIFADFRVTITGASLAAEVAGEPLDVGRHAPAVEPKGATMTALRVARGEDGRWLAQCVVDV